MTGLENIVDKGKETIDVLMEVYSSNGTPTVSPDIDNEGISKE